MASSAKSVGAYQMNRARKATGLPVEGSRLNTASFIPLYVQLTEILQERIEQGRWAPGERFPSESELSAEFGVSRAVIRPALTILENNGQIARIKGKGTFVSTPKSVDRVQGLVRDLSGAIGKGRTVIVTDVNLEQADDELAEIMELQHAGEILHVPSVLEMDQRVLGFRDSFITTARVPGLTGTLERARRFGSVRSAPQVRVALRPSEVTVETSFATPFEAEIFGVSPGVPTLLVSCLERARVDGRVLPVEFARMVYRADVVMLETSSR